MDCLRLWKTSSRRGRYRKRDAGGLRPGPRVKVWLAGNGKISVVSEVKTFGEGGRANAKADRSSVVESMVVVFIVGDLESRLHVC